MQALVGWLGARADGAIDRRVYWVLRVGLASLVLLRTTSLAADLLGMAHPQWAGELEWWSDATVSDPPLRIPLFVAVPLWLDRPLLVIRWLAAITMLVGVAPRFSSAVVGVVGLLLMNADQFRYFHHLYLLYLACVAVALCPSGWKGPTMRARWPLQLIRFQVILIYLASGFAKCNPDWLSGETLSTLGDLGLLRSTTPLPCIPEAWIAVMVATMELALVPLLALRRLRGIGIAVAAVLHVGIATQMTVSTFGITMLLLLTAFWPPWKERFAQS